MRGPRGRSVNVTDTLFLAGPPGARRASSPPSGAFTALNHRTFAVPRGPSVGYRHPRRDSRCASQRFAEGRSAGRPAVCCPAAWLFVCCPWVVTVYLPRYLREPQQLHEPKEPENLPDPQQLRRAADLQSRRRCAQGRAQSRCRCAQGRAQSRRRCAQAERSPDADVRRPEVAAHYHTRPHRLAWFGSTPQESVPVHACARVRARHVCTCMRVRGGRRRCGQVPAQM